MKIFVSGKGGSGKSTVSALLARELSQRGKRVLVVDNDESNFGLHTHLGLSLPRDFMYYFGGKDNLFEESEKIRDGIKISEVPDEYLSQENNLNLLAIGKISEYGEGCACPMNVLSGEFLDKLSLNNDEILIVDMDAGVEHFGRKVEEGADAILTVVDPTKESIKLSEKIAKFGEEIEKNVYFVLNKITGNSKDLILESIDEEKVLGILPRDGRVFEAGLKGEKLDFKLGEIEKVANSLLEMEN